MLNKCELLLALWPLFALVDKRVKRGEGVEYLEVSGFAFILLFPLVFSPMFPLKCTSVLLGLIKVELGTG